MSWNHIKNRFLPKRGLDLTDKKSPQSLLDQAKKNLPDFNKNILALSDADLLSYIESENKNEVGLTRIYLPFFSTMPWRVTAELIESLKKKDQVVIQVCINHPFECTSEVFEACEKLANAGFILNNRMTLLKGINDSPEVVKELNLKLLMMRVRPYSIYLYQNSCAFFDVDFAKGIEILDSLRGWTSGLAVPHFLVQQEDLRFKAYLPEYIKKAEGESFTFRNYKNLDYEYNNL